MKLVSFRHGGRDGYGLLEGDAIAAFHTLPDAPADLKTAIERGVLPALAAAASSGPSLADVTLLPVIPNPGKILCVGHNYESHRQETGRAKVGHPSIFTRFADTLVAHGQPILRPVVSENLDYEGELAVIIGRTGRHIAEGDALSFVAGYAPFNDASVRDWQWHTQQFTPGKNFPATGGFGPWMVTPDALPDPSTTSVTTRLNGEIMQQQPTADMLFTIPVIIAYVSQFTTLNAGDVICTGTPGGVGAKRTPPVWMKPGDVIEIDIPGVGVLSNTIAPESRD